MNVLSCTFLTSVNLFCLQDTVFFSGWLFFTSFHPALVCWRNDGPYPTTCDAFPLSPKKITTRIGLSIDLDYGHHPTWAVQSAIFTWD
ncbi:uncharacterized protein K452DRAFT_8481 [Aplosporella prunicola CBS 121167]|uniref:Uncharacterized protein n=1 Tax=Aplosporella prunicola CBS 121167 TaxID=1176127 RepID=A0A6A6BTS8_9PEZI|nr:uncharacterized protein K452DRAFT_8481 [Aplosporella prunicola CBS 121167]KAF2147522.1 hypothetical protein K452DRAFT_8481 [Aplosporella prunicola CBS 121167]